MICNLCPHNCGAERTTTVGLGRCHAPYAIRLARAGLHQWEEPCLVGDNGAGAVFFSGCNLRCVYCQNKEISQGDVGKVVSVSQLQEIFQSLIDQGAACLDLVTPSHVAPLVSQALDMDIPIPVVWNCGGYESVETLQSLAGKVDVYLPDFKYALSTPGLRYSGAEDYPQVATQAILEMFRQTGSYQMEGTQLRRGVLVRHLMLPGQLENTKCCLDWLSATFAPGDILVSLMSQYTPQPDATGALARHVSRREYQAGVDYMASCGMVDGYTQQRTSAQVEYTPPFDLSGIDCP